MFSRTVIRSTPLEKRDLVFGNDFAGRTLAYRSKRLRSSTLIEEKPSPTGVVGGDWRSTVPADQIHGRLRQQLAVLLQRDHAGVRRTRRKGPATASSTMQVASMISGPIPSRRG